MYRIHKRICSAEVKCRDRLHELGNPAALPDATVNNAVLRLRLQHTANQARGVDLRILPIDPARMRCNDNCDPIRGLVRGACPVKGKQF
jgi:hypothetical protein